MSTRERILDAAEQILRTRGVAHATTKEIAKASGLSEPGLYRHFSDKEDLLLHVLRERVPGASQPHVAPGEGEIEANLAEMARAALDFYQRSFPMLASLLADPQRMAAHRESMSRHGGGPDKAVSRFAAYLRAEQDLGRVAAAADPDAAASLLIGACFQQAFLRYYAEGPDAAPAPASTARALARTVTRALG
ncbi:transcriptional regulator, TetR family [Streptomyces sp. DvalAA-14]|uniref:TetR/AcrR family transcriptional regulator n=1 Tax=unclassified Streptomyces TaxID=2593676 RepID=UPI00081B71BC|nr:TetR/AcrR family transcriptional regulator [Streptomyces sp. DvalAA-14]MYS23056.1 TetR family transcriptional regulator [Streptomyces sp. SID4948]SCE26646.1 transcriptional regulator, TetR family [Streptomyces sp. DvalAA-14]